jgi:UDP-N-acetylmuramoyl-tripeptide--D-alanyl-D-alanine ligase
MIELIAAPYLPGYASTLVYMLQNTEYRVGPYLKWFWRTQNFGTVMQRRQLELTKAAKALRIVLWLGMVLQILAGLLLIYLWYWHGLPGGWEFGLALIVSYPIVWAHLIIVPLLLGRIFIIIPHERWLIVRSEQIFAKHHGAKVAIAGSYGKTSMKEILLTVLGEGKKVAATPGNKNVSISHARFALGLTGHEDVVLLEYGEGAPGDVRRFTLTTHPTHAIITGLAPAHLDRYKTIERAGKDIFSVTRYVKPDHVIVNDESPDLRPFIRPGFIPYDSHGAFGWKVSRVSVSLDGTRFTISKGKQSMKLQSGLLGRHNIGPLCLAATLADQFGMSKTAIAQGISKTKPFEHRMQPYQLSGAWIIDDTYNGNLEGIRAGTGLLAELKAKRKLYVTPGLVDQGKHTQEIHVEVGQLIASSKADIVVLMQNSVTESIRQGLDTGKFKGQLIIENSPLRFYENLGHFVAAGDLVMLQNDWPDNYD